MLITHLSVINFDLLIIFRNRIIIIILNQRLFLFLINVILANFILANFILALCPKFNHS